MENQNQLNIPLGSINARSYESNQDYRVSSASASATEVYTIEGKAHPQIKIIQGDYIEKLK